MAFDINAFQKKYKAVIEQNRLLKEQVDSWAANKAHDIEAAVMAAVTPLRNQVSELKHDLGDRERRVTAHGVVRAELEAKVSEHDQAIAEQMVTIRVHEKRNRELLDQLADAQPAIAAAEARANDALTLLKKHEDRMSEKHRQELAAIENRKALAGAVPAPNRR